MDSIQIEIEDGDEIKYTMEFEVPFSSIFNSREDGKALYIVPGFQNYKKPSNRANIILYTTIANSNTTPKFSDKIWNSFSVITADPDPFNVHGRLLFSYLADRTLGTNIQLWWGNKVINNFFI